MAVKKDLVGNPLRNADGTVRKSKRRVESLRAVMKSSAVPAVGGIVAGGVASGVAMAVINRVPMLARWSASGGWKQAGVQTGVAVTLSGIGLALYGKATSPQKAVKAAPWVLGGTLALSLAPILATEVVERINGLLQGLFRPGVPQVAPSGKRMNDGSALGPRRASTAAEVQEAERLRLGGAPGGQQTRVAPRVPQTIDMPQQRW